MLAFKIDLKLVQKGIKKKKGEEKTFWNDFEEKL